ncbi:isochorismatase, partial [Rhizobium ruizarguesonis]
VAQTPALLVAARAAGIPFIHTRILYLAENCADGGMWVKKSPVMMAMVEGNVLAEFCDGVEPKKALAYCLTMTSSPFSG